MSRRSLLRGATAAGAASLAGMTATIAQEGTVTIVYLEAEDIERALEGIGSSQEPFDQWWREQVATNHGIDPARPGKGPSNEMIIDFR